LIRDVRPRCTAIAQAGAPPVIYTVCAAEATVTTYKDCKVGVIQQMIMDSDEGLSLRMIKDAWVESVSTTAG
jgi:hypothetical protein